MFSYSFFRIRWIISGMFGDLQGILSSRLLMKCSAAAAAGLTVVLNGVELVEMMVVGLEVSGREVVVVGAGVI